MKLVAAAVVRNEADIIEAFVRHTLTWVDHCLVLDHASTDGTRRILAALRQEGLPITVLVDDEPANLQAARCNFLAQQAVARQGADWVLMLDADEFLVGGTRPELEAALAAHDPERPALVPLLNYHATAQDDPAEPNPALRLQACEAAAGPTCKVMVSRRLLARGGARLTKGNHAVVAGDSPVEGVRLPGAFVLAHLALRSPAQLALRLALNELQRLAAGRRMAGVDQHYRLGFQLLREDPARFFAATLPREPGRRQPIAYRGGALRHAAPADDWYRAARALLPVIEGLAASHGRLLDAADGAAATPAGEPAIRELSPADVTGLAASGGSADFSGFTAVAGWGPAEGPVPAAFLPVFHWGFAPATRLSVRSERGGTGTLVLEVLTYSDGQEMRIELNGAALRTVAFPQVNEKQVVHCTLPLRPGNNELVLHYARHLATAADPRQLAVIFLSLTVRP